MYSETGRVSIIAAWGKFDHTDISYNVVPTYNVTALTVALLVQGVEGLPPETGVAGDARETLHVEHLLHGDAAAAIADHVVTTAGAASWKCIAEAEIRILLVFKYQKVIMEQGLYQNSPQKGGGSCHTPTSWWGGPALPQALLRLSPAGRITCKKVQNWSI